MSHDLGLRLGMALVFCAIAGVSAAADRHVGYYYPEPLTRETYVARSITLPDATRKRRILFVTELMNQMIERNYPPQFALLVKGEDAEKLVITGLYDSGYNTMYRMRGLLAMLSARARITPLFAAYEVEDLFTFFDLAKMLGFSLITISDGDKFAHQIRIE